MYVTTARISHKNLIHNIGLIRSAIGGRRIMAVVKANAYGHGDLEVAASALQAGCEYLGVALTAEGIRLRENGITAPVLVFGAQLPENFHLAARHDLIMTVTSAAQVDNLNAELLEKTMKIVKNSIIIIFIVLLYCIFTCD